ncbi:MAG: 16S rRNA (guanine(966)-N(2))-methyltransferase RsmD [Acidobacteriota bacterium]|jgi:16S rRNA (guanine966-N2)-methyltransferase|nr:16S rRNA (guanine(966)-N(2))-methyltransferase RsmD [Acidobacteriota bacterium]
MPIRVVGGFHRGRTLRAPRGEDTRPTSDRTREAIFNMLGPLPPHCRALDLCAGSGAMGIEALSRGAGWVDLVDRAAPACAAIRGNLEALGLTDRSAVHRADAAAWLLASAPIAPYDLVFADPPYGSDVLAAVAEALGVRADRIAPGGRVVFEADGEDMPVPPLNIYHCLRARRYGRAHVAIFERVASEPQADTRGTA